MIIPASSGMAKSLTDSTPKIASIITIKKVVSEVLILLDTGRRWPELQQGTAETATGFMPELLHEVNYWWSNWGIRDRKDFRGQRS